MMYLKWLVYAVIDVLFNIVCYLTNPIVVLTSSEYGNLPRLLIWWDNYDDCLDVEYFVKDHAPHWARYDYDRHYKFHSNVESLQTRGIYKSYVDILDPYFTFKERLQRYICRVLWLYRNNAYGFSYYVTGVVVKAEDVIKIKTSEVNGYTWYKTSYAFCYKDERPSFFGMRWDNYVGWKLNWLKAGEEERCMLAVRITPFDKR